MKVQSDSIDTQALIGASQIGSGAVGPALADGQSAGSPVGLEALAPPVSRPQAALDPGESLLMQDVWAGAGESRSLAAHGAIPAGIAQGPDALAAYVLEPLT